MSQGVLGIPGIPLNFAKGVVTAIGMLGIPGIPVNVSVPSTSAVGFVGIPGIPVNIGQVPPAGETVLGPLCVAAAEIAVLVPVVDVAHGMEAAQVAAITTAVDTVTRYVSAEIGATGAQADIAALGAIGQVNCD